MPRPLRLEFPGACYHVLSRGNEGKDIFRVAGDCKLFLNLLKDCAERFDFLIHAYCLMPNHFHLLLETKDSNLSQVMKRLLGVYTMRFNNKYHRRGHLFQGRYKAFLIDKDNYFLELSRYVHLNPVRAKLVRIPEDYRWSSMKFFLKGKVSEILHRDFTLAGFKSPAKYRQFVMEGLQSSGDTLKKPIGGLFWSSEEFVEKFKKQIAKSKNKDFSGKRELLKVLEDKLKNSLESRDQSFQIYCLWKYAKLGQKEIGNRFSITGSAVCHSIKRFTKRLNEDKTLNNQIEELKAKIQFSVTDP
jgi:putative transposase